MSDLTKKELEEIEKFIEKRNKTKLQKQLNALYQEFANSQRYHTQTSKGFAAEKHLSFSDFLLIKLLNKESGSKNMEKTLAKLQKIQAEKKSEAEQAEEQREKLEKQIADLEKTKKEMEDKAKKLAKKLKKTEKE